MTYTYTNRDQLESRLWGGDLIGSFAYDVNGNLATRVASTTPTTTSTYTYDALDRVTHISHDLVGGTGDVFGYDYAEQPTR